MRIRALFIDMDGTLLKSSNKISRRNAEAITKLMNHGVKVFLATGRQYEITAPYHSHLDLKTPMICLNGASIYDGFTGRIAHMNPVILDEEQFYRVTNENSCNVMVHTADGLYCNRKSREVEEWTEESRIVPKYIGDLQNADYRDVLKYSVRTGNHGSQLSYMFCSGVEVIDWQDGFEIVAEGVSKWAGIQELIAKFGIHPDETAAIGDGPNDMQMLKNAGISAAMANAGEEIKAAADVVTGHHEKDGLADFIERYLLKEPAAPRVL
ncbi:HAD family hydrolase [Virgibacillus sp. YIM 98842]|uniref:HAD family hydrolase n=1 Tax=Virgibacillus sp. YIM 98842 TaxID=2663533 RepID=UPI0013DC19F5|nr:HAD family hydrolase [Virgibacillus sp. YIM 98842]